MWLRPASRPRTSLGSTLCNSLARYPAWSLTKPISRSPSTTKLRSDSTLAKLSSACAEFIWMAWLWTKPPTLTQRHGILSFDPRSPTTMVGRHGSERRRAGISSGSNGTGRARTASGSRSCNEPASRGSFLPPNSMTLKKARPRMPTSKSTSAASTWDVRVRSMCEALKRPALRSG